MNQNMNQVQQSNQVSQEELAKTQVLNLTDVQEIAKFERKTSKRPAVLFAIAGVLSLMLGLSYSNIMALVDSIPTSTKNFDAKAVEREPVLNKVQENMTSCKYTSPENADGTIGKVTYNLIFNEIDQLQSYTMILEMDPISGNANGLVSVQNIYNSYRALDVITLTGYTSETIYTDTGMKTTITVDLTTFDPTTLTATHNANYFAKVPYTLGTSKEVITQQLTAGNYICQ